MKKTGDYYVAVVEDTNAGHIIATATLILEHKFIHSCAKVNQHSATINKSSLFPGGSNTIVYWLFFVYLEVEYYRGYLIMIMLSTVLSLALSL